MRPEFLLNFIMLSPNASQVRETFKSIFPTLLGMRLSSRIKEDVSLEILRALKDLKEIDGARANVMVGDMSNALKSDPDRGYIKVLIEHGFDPSLD